MADDIDDIDDKLDSYSSFADESLDSEPEDDLLLERFQFEPEALALERAPVDEEFELEFERRRGFKLWYPKAKKVYYSNGKEVRMGSSANKYSNDYPEGAVVHFTAGASRLKDKNAENDIRNATRKGYVFFCIASTGNVYQAAPLNVYGGHAGRSYYKELGKNVSNKLVGIEINNAGKMRKSGNGFKTSFGRKHSAKDVRHVEEAYSVYIPKGVTNRKGKDVSGTYPIPPSGYYLKYTREQETALWDLLVWLKENNPHTFKFKYVVGHDEIAPWRKNDPGGALSVNMRELRRRLNANQPLGDGVSSPTGDGVSGPGGHGGVSGPATNPGGTTGANVKLGDLTIGPRFEELCRYYAGVAVEFPDLKDITFAQWALETGYGKSILATRHLNFGGMKWRKEMAKYGQPVPYKASHDPQDSKKGQGKYCSFNSLERFVQAYWAWLERWPYKGWRSRADNPTDFMSFVGAKWAPTGAGQSDQNDGYARKINNVRAKLERAGLLPSLMGIAPPIVDPPITEPAPPVTEKPSPELLALAGAYKKVRDKIEARHLWDVTLAHWTVKSDFGKAPFAKSYNNFIGLRWNEASVAHSRLVGLKATKVDPLPGQSYYQFPTLLDFIRGYWTYMNFDTALEKWTDHQDPDEFARFIAAILEPQDAEFASRVINVSRNIESIFPDTL